MSVTLADRAEILRRRRFLRRLAWVRHQVLEDAHRLAALRERRPDLTDRERLVLLDVPDARLGDLRREIRKMRTE